jgi:hypothetical protein
MKNYKLLIINGSGTLREIFKGRLQRGNKFLGKSFFRLPFIINHL